MRRIQAHRVAAVALILGPAVLQAQTADDRPTYRGRAIADVMSFRGAPWLERPSREQEENSNLLMRSLGLRSGQRVVDLGCGSGYYSRRMAKAVGSAGKVYGVDIQPEMLEYFSTYARQEGITNMVPVLGTAESMQLPEEVVGKVDLVLLVDVYHELQQPQAMLADIRRALAPEGRVALVEFRLQGSTAAHIKIDHRMSVQQVLAEWEPAGFALVQQIEDLPTQHLFLFEKAQR